MNHQPFEPLDHVYRRHVIPRHPLTQREWLFIAAIASLLAWDIGQLIAQYT